MNHPITFAQAQSNYDNMLPPDDSMREMAYDRLCDAIEADPERLLAAVYETDCDEAETLAKLRIVLREASVALRALRSTGIPQAQFQCIRDLVAVADEADTFVAEKIKQAADKEMS